MASESMQTFDAVIIGSGQGGNPLAHTLADLGWTVALIEREHLGGTCVNYGCTPTKTMIASARVAHVARRAASYGVHTGEIHVNLQEVVARKNDMVHQWRDAQERRVADRPTLKVIRGHARFTGPHAIDVEGQPLRSKRIFINTGTRPHIPLLEGISEVDVLTNRTVMDLEELPPHLIVLGGSFVGLEFGQMFRRFGSEVTVVDRNDRIIPKEDPEISGALRDALEAEGIRFHLGEEPQVVSQSKEGVRLTLAGANDRPSTITGSHLLVATGRIPNSDDLALDAAGVRTDAGGFITVNDRLETSVDGIWAIGDVKGGPAFTHISYDDHLIVLDNVVNGRNRSADGRIVPYALFTDPELGRVGLTETQAREAGYRLKIGIYPISRVARAIERGETAGLLKVVIDAESDRILGAAILAVDGGELVQTLMAVMLADAPWTVLRKAIYIHPTMTEGFFGLMDAVGAGSARERPERA